MADQTGVMESDALARCIEACIACAQACTICAAACLDEEDIDMLRLCIRRDLDCADLCATMATVASRGRGADGAVMRALLEATARSTALTAEECGKHEHHGHCKACAEAARRCEAACQGAVASFAQR